MIVFVPLFIFAFMELLAALVSTERHGWTFAVHWIRPNRQVKGTGCLELRQMAWGLSGLPVLPHARGP